ncbi:uncharacterized protein Z518_08727 [Rhinocladiella mackenziei CBS 650.93]|uniref:Glutamyl-tRNA(Gln) amidotransferase subunit A, mitochondrial n=1 Tax=Rhinocladiella mackenziei CBS 650.93 TaxID=1442369 RepID=A0A0D2J1K4_9EURO|nr:uncharacterized protein Z518_08727 [Rhinocladiella mackenziei CBS 650.93]KIX02785.1 hypothetical protein Z518_08727 [Rhinocladiella mackenziei CBS 650.93]
MRYRDPRDVHLSRQVRNALRRAQLFPGNPFISRPKDVDHRVLLQWVTQLQGRYEKERYHSRMKSSNEGYTAAIKDNIVTQQLPTTCASNILKGFYGPRGATVTRLLEKAGMILLGKTNMDEFGMGSHTTNSAFGPVFNGTLNRDKTKRSHTLSVGGSSGGSALAVAQGQVHIGIGTDTGGSIRLPAAYLGLVGFKPSYGLISRNGVVPYANSLDTVGIIGRSALDVLITFDLLQVPDVQDPTCLTAQSRERITYTKDLRRKLVLGENFLWTAGSARLNSPTVSRRRQAEMKRRLFDEQMRTRRIGVPLEYNVKEMHPLVRWAWTATLSHLESLGFTVVPISLPSTKHALSSYYILAPAEASSNLAKYDGVRYGAPRAGNSDHEGGTLYSRYRYDHFGPEVRRRILLGTYSLSAGAMDNYFIQAQKIRRMVQRDFDSVFRMPNPLREDSEFNENGVDLIVVPTAPTPPPHLRFLEKAGPLESYMNDVFTVPASLAGLPAISVPGPRHPEHPWKPELSVGIQAIGQYGDDHSVIYFARNFLTDFHDLENLNRIQQRKLLS